VPGHRIHLLLFPLAVALLLKVLPRLLLFPLVVRIDFVIEEVFVLC
jgi:hypothetical protein